jgi:uncharacterized membrane protein YdjX (TVP38/TMEM64 family)
VKSAAIWVFVLLFCCALIFFHQPIENFLTGILDWIATLGVWGPIFFALVYILACVFFIPGSVLTLGAGAVFGVVKGFILVSISSTLGATAAFLIGRYFARDWVAKKIGNNATFNAIDHAAADEGWKIVGLTRLSPLFPFSLMNYAFGLTRVSLRDYFVASWIGMMPGTLMYVYLGSLARVARGQTPPLEWTLRIVGLVATVLVTILLARMARQALAQRVK